MCLCSLFLYLFFLLIGSLELYVGEFFLGKDFLINFLLLNVSGEIIKDFYFFCFGYMKFRDEVIWVFLGRKLLELCGLVSIGSLSFFESFCFFGCFVYFVCVFGSLFKIFWFGCFCICSFYCLIDFLSEFIL